MTSLSRRKKEIEESRRAFLRAESTKDIPLWLHFPLVKLPFTIPVQVRRTKHQEDVRSDVCVLADSQRKGKSRHVQLNRCTTTVALIQCCHTQTDKPVWVQVRNQEKSHTMKSLLLSYFFQVWWGHLTALDSERQIQIPWCHQWFCKPVKTGRLKAAWQRDWTGWATSVINPERD